MRSVSFTKSLIGLVLFGLLISIPGTNADDVEFIELTSSTPKYQSTTSLDQGETSYFNFTIPSEDVDVKIRLRVYDGDADVYALFTSSSSAEDNIPSSSKFDFRSEHAHRDDVIFISRYDIQKWANASNGGSVVGMYFRIAVEGWAAHGSEYALEFETFTNARSLSEAHKTALGNIFDACCSASESLCVEWREGNEYAGSGKELDLCHYDGNVCDENGNLEEFDARWLFQFNRAQTEDNCEFPSEALKTLMTPSMRRFQMSGYYYSGSYRKIFKEVTLANVSEVLEASKSANVLEHFEIALAGVTGTLDVDFGADCDKLPLSLHTINVQGNGINGTIPKCALERMHVLIVQDNELTGALPELDNPENSNVAVLYAGGNELEGALPASLVNGNFAKNLTYLELSENKLSGELPDEWNVPKLRALHMEDNLFTGQIPATLGTNAPNLQTIHLNENQFSGSIPQGVCDDEAREAISVANNQLNVGGIPTSVYENDGSGRISGKNLLSLDVSNNALSENIPVWIQQAPKLKYFYLHDNEFTGNLPQVSTNWPSLIQFSAKNNKFVGNMPDKLDFGAMFRTSPTLVNNQYYTTAIIHFADVSNNILTGTAPSWVSQYQGSQIQFALITGNIFDCEIPSELAYLNLDCREENGSVRYAVNDDGVAGADEVSKGQNVENSVGWLGEKDSARFIVLIGFMCFLGVTIMYWIYKGIIKQWFNHMRDVRRDRALGGRFWELEEEYQEYNRAISASRQMAAVNESNTTTSGTGDVELAGVPSELTPYTQYVVNNAAAAAPEPTSHDNDNNNNTNNHNPFSNSPSRSQDDSSESESSPGGTRRWDRQRSLSDRARRNLMLAERVHEQSSSPPRSVDRAFRGQDGLFRS